LRNTKAVTLGDLIDGVLEFTADHKDKRNYVSKAEIVREAVGARPAAEILPEELDRWLKKHCTTAATTNRYKAFVSLCYREGMRNGKVTVNPARLVRPRKEPRGRLRFLSRIEYDSLLAAIRKRFPEHVAEFIVSVHMGMRLSEQYSVTWSQVHLERRAIDLTNTKNGSDRTVHLNADAITAIEALKRKGQKGSDPVFPRDTDSAHFDNRSWFVPCLEDAKVTG
jgi:integrase